MANVKFLRGTQTNLNTLINGSGNRFTEGAFYLTTDTDRLYVAQSASELVLLNSIVKHVANETALNAISDYEVGDFYYLDSENILCVRTATGWKQINKNTTLSADADNITVTDANGGGALVTITVTDDSATPHVSTGSFIIKGGDARTTVAQENGVITISTAAATNTTYDLSAVSGNKIRLAGNDSTNDDVTIAGSGLLANNISTNTSTNTITLNVPVPTTTVEQTFDDSGVLTTIVTDSAATTAGSDTITPIIKLGTNSTEYKFIGTSAGSASGTATLPVYTKTEVDTAINNAKATIDAMTYKGTVSSSEASTKLASTGNVGDTYKATNEIKNIGGVTGNDAKAGDLIIAEGTDGNVTWSVIPSGNDQSISAEVDASDKSFIVSDNDVAIGGIAIAAGSHISATGSVSGNVNTITVAQAQDYTAQTASGSSSNVTLNGASSVDTSQTFTAVTAIQTDAYGNVVNNSVQTKTLTVVDTHAHPSSTNVGVSVNNNNATVELSVTDDDDITSTAGNLYLTTNGSVAVTGSGSTVYLDIVWGTFNS